MRVVLPTLVLLSVTAASAPSIELSLQRVLTSCGAAPKRMAVLDRVAEVYAQTGSVKRSAQAVGYAYQNIQGLRANGDAAFVIGGLRGICGKLGGLIAYGLAPYGRGLSIVVADPKTPPGLGSAHAEGFRLLAATNAARARGATCGGKFYPPAPPLLWDDRLFAAAQRYAQRQAALNFIGHVDPYDGADLAARVHAVNFYGGYGENLSHGPNTPELAVKSLLSSPGHCANLMDPGWTVMGGAFATSDASDYGIYWVQNFGRPQGR